MCDGPLPPPKQGPPRRTCSQACRSRRSRDPAPGQEIKALTGVVDLQRKDVLVELVFVTQELGVLWRRAGRNAAPNVGWRCERIGLGVQELLDKEMGL